MSLSAVYYSYQIKFCLLLLQRPDGEVQLNKIRDVVYVDDDPSDPYQFNVIIDGRRPWKLKASSEVWCIRTIVHVHVP